MTGDVSMLAVLSQCWFLGRGAVISITIELLEDVVIESCLDEGGRRNEESWVGDEGSAMKSRSPRPRREL